MAWSGYWNVDGFAMTPLKNCNEAIEINPESRVIDAVSFKSFKSPE